MSTTSICSPACSRFAYAFSPSTTSSLGLIGIILYPFDCIYRDTLLLGREASLDNPTTAIVFASARSFEIAFGSFILTSVSLDDRNSRSGLRVLGLAADKLLKLSREQSSNP